MLKSCERHLVPNCPLCAKPSAMQTIPVMVNATIETNGVPVVTPRPANTPPPEPQITDTHAQKMLAAAGKYAQECEAVKTISEAVTTLTEVLAASKDKLKEAELNRDAAQKEMMTLLSPKPYTVSATAAVKTVSDASHER